MKHEASPAEAEKGGGVVGFFKRLNKITAAVLLSAGVILESVPLLALGAFDVLQSWVLGKFEKSRKTRKVKKLGRAALAH